MTTSAAIEVKDEVEAERHGGAIASASANAAKHELCHRPVAAQCSSRGDSDNATAACLTPTNDNDDGSDDAFKACSAGAGGRTTSDETPGEEGLRRKRESARASVRGMRRRRAAASAGANAIAADFAELCVLVLLFAELGIAELTYLIVSNRPTTRPGC